MKKLFAIVSLILCLVPISGADPGYTGNVGEARLGNHWVVTPSGFFNYQTNNPDFIGAVNAVVTNGGGGGVNLLPLNNVWTGSNSFTGPVVGTFTDTAGNPYPTLGLLLGGSVSPSFSTLSATVVNSSLFFGPYRFPNGNLIFDNADTTNAVPPNSAVSVSATNWIPGAIAAISTNDASGAAKQATNGLGNAAFGSTNTMKVFAATNADLATLATTATTASAVSVTDTNNLVFQSGLAIKGSNYVFQATFSGLNGATGSVSIINGVLSLTLGTSNQFTPANLATLASALQAGSTLNGANLSAGTVADVALASTFLKTVPVGTTNWLQNIVNLTSNQVISMSQANSNQVIAQAGVAISGSNYLVTVPTGATNNVVFQNGSATNINVIISGAANSFLISGTNSSGIESLVTNASPTSWSAMTVQGNTGNFSGPTNYASLIFNNSGFVAGSTVIGSSNDAVIESSGGNLMIEPIGGGKHLYAVSRTSFTSATVTNMDMTPTGVTFNEQINGNGGGLTNTPSSFVPYVGGDWAATFTMVSGGQSFFTPNGGGNQSPVGSDVNARTDCDGFSYATNFSLTLNTSGGGFQVNTNYVAYMITNSVSSSNAMSAIISGPIGSSTFPRNISANSITMIGVTNFTFVLYYIGSGGGASGTTRARISVQLVQTH